jgi:hypothetical protein
MDIETILEVDWKVIHRGKESIPNFISSSKDNSLRSDINAGVAATVSGEFLTRVD